MNKAKCFQFTSSFIYPKRYFRISLSSASAFCLMSLWNSGILHIIFSILFTQFTSLTYLMCINCPMAAIYLSFHLNDSIYKLQQQQHTHAVYTRIRCQWVQLFILNVSDFYRICCKHYIRLQNKRMNGKKAPPIKSAIKCRQKTCLRIQSKYTHKHKHTSCCLHKFVHISNGKRVVNVYVNHVVELCFDYIKKVL